VNHHDEAIQHAPSLDLKGPQERAAWLEWVECWYPHDLGHEAGLRSRMPADAPPVQSPEELGDLAGVSDREMAWCLARAWSVIRDRESRRRGAATRMPTQQAQQTRDDLFASLDRRAEDNYEDAGYR
jgi:hypothetical protein